jgi:hypothetical protein
MSRYEFYVPPVRDWPTRWWASYKMLYRATLGRTWRDINALRSAAWDR